MKREDVHRVLSHLGNEISQYHQADRIAGNPHLRGSVGSGYCAGACLDWIRRVLQGGKPAFKADLDPAAARQDKNAANALLEQKPAKRDAFYDKRKLRLTEWFNKEQDQNEAKLIEVQKKAQEILAERSVGLNQTEYDLLVAKVQTSLDKQIGLIQKQKTDVKAQYGQLTSKESLLTQFWKGFGQAVDAHLKQGKPNGSSRPFSNLSVVCASDDRLYPNGVEGLVDAVLGNKGFGAGCASYVGVTPPLAKTTGHAIAIHRMNTGGVYQFFEPNFGVYELNFDKLRTAFLFLFLRAYPGLEDSNNHDHKNYEIGGKVNGEYVIFRNAQTLPPAVQRYPSSGATAVVAKLQ